MHRIRPILAKDSSLSEQPRDDAAPAPGDRAPADRDGPVLQPSEEAPPATVIPAATEDPDATVGTGSAIALGCIAATLLLIVVGLIFLVIVAVLN